jgi:hypothetical protein
MRGENGETVTIIHLANINEAPETMGNGCVCYMDIYRLLLNDLVLLHTKCYLLCICWQKKCYNLYDAWHQTLLASYDHCVLCFLQSGTPRT